jgi:hypothetical protein
MDWLQEDATSPWNTACKPINSSCPASLQPTLVQRTIVHHPWIDLFPIPRMSLTTNTNYAMTLLISVMYRAKERAWLYGASHGIPLDGRSVNRS